MRLKCAFSAAISLLLPPCWIKNGLLRLLGWRIGANCRIGFSWIRSSRVLLSRDARIGHANFIDLEAVYMGAGANIGHMNRATGPLWLVLKERAAIGHQNKVIRAKRGISWGRSMLKLGVWTKITSGHVVDCCRSVVLGDYTTIAGLHTQIWTHGYLHAPTGIDRFRIDGGVRIGNNVYIGSACVINAGISIGSGISVGSASCVSRSLCMPGLYVSQVLRMVPLDYEMALTRHPQVRVGSLVEMVVNKKPEIVR